MEIWKAIIGFEGYYEVSNYGQVRSFDRTEAIGKLGFRKRKGRVLKLTPDKDGYVQVQLRAPGKKSVGKVHRLVACAFIENTENKPQVNHKNGIKNDNNSENLEWVTGSENGFHAFKTGLRKPTDVSGEKNPRYKTGINTHGEFKKNCEHCGSEFVAKILRYRFCSRSCKNFFVAKLRRENIKEYFNDIANGRD